MFLDVRGCIQENRRVEALAEAERESRHAQIVETLPDEWKIIYSGMLGTHFSNDRFTVLKNYLSEKPESEKMPHLNDGQVRLFLDTVRNGAEVQTFTLVTNRMEMNHD